MALIERFEDIHAKQKARKLTKQVYAITHPTPGIRHLTLIT